MKRPTLGTQEGTTVTRRSFLTRVGAVGGAALTYEAMTALGLLAAPSQTTFKLDGRVSGVRVVILGAGLSGMTAAYELGKAGFDCRVVEARARPGGRVFTVRRGTASEETGASHSAAFDDGLYFNAGPMRISHHHHTVRQNERGVWIIYSDGRGQPRRVEADFCISTIPLPALIDIEKDLSQPVQAAITSSRYDGAGKIGMQVTRRFWEQDDEIYGGRSWSDQEVGQIVYPSHGFTTAKGILVGYYLDFRGTMRERPPAEIQRLALEHGARVHPQFSTEFENAFSVTWSRVPWNRGSWRSESSSAHEALAPLREPDGRVYFAGDYMTQSSWMEGAFESAREVATALHQRALARGSATVESLIRFVGTSKWRRWWTR